MSLKDRKLLSVKIVWVLNPLKSSGLNNVYIPTQVTSIFEVAQLITF